MTVWARSWRTFFCEQCPHAVSAAWHRLRACLLQTHSPRASIEAASAEAPTCEQTPGASVKKIFYKCGLPYAFFRGVCCSVAHALAHF